MPERQYKGQVGRSFRTEMSVSVVYCFALFDSRIVIRTGANGVFQIRFNTFLFDSEASIPFLGPVCHMEVLATDSLVHGQHGPHQEAQTPAQRR